MRLHFLLAFVLGVLAITSTALAAPDQTPGRITGIGGVFIKAKDPKVLAAWYRDVLGMPVQPWGGAALSDDAPGHPPKTAWTVFDASSDQFAPSTSAFMINYAVDDMDAMVKRLQNHGVTVLKRTEDDTFGRFAWIVDPDGNKVELWEPKRQPAP
jgi:predicted enzyme related to lactoylglutathione lyase